MQAEQSVDLARAALEKEGDQMVALEAQGEEGAWQMGVHYNNIVDGELAEKAGFPSAKLYFNAKIKRTSQATLSRNGRVAKAFSREIAAKYGATKLQALLAYETLAQLNASPPDPGQVAIRVPEEGGTATKSFADCSAAEIGRAIHQLKAPTSAPAENEVALVRHLQDLVDQALGEHNSVAVCMRKTKKEPILNLEHIPLSQFATVIQALARSVGFAAVTEPADHDPTAPPIPLTERKQGSAGGDEGSAAWALGKTAGQRWKALTKLFGT